MRDGWLNGSTAGGFAVAIIIIHHEVAFVGCFPAFRADNNHVPRWVVLTMADPRAACCGGRHCRDNGGKLVELSLLGSILGIGRWMCGFVLGCPVLDVDVDVAAAGCPLLDVFSATGGQRMRGMRRFMEGKITEYSGMSPSDFSSKNN